MVGTGYFPGGEEQAYRCDERDDLCLVGTAEVPVTALHRTRSSRSPSCR
jgi:seryl-tRNA synthetase